MKTAVASPAGFLPLNVGSQGGFPYVWNNQLTDAINASTYQWISSAAIASKASVSLNGHFPNDFLDVISKISYQIEPSKRPQVANSEYFVNALLGSPLFGSLKENSANGNGGDSVLTDQAIGTVLNEWSTRPIILSDLGRAKNWPQLFSEAPKGGEQVLKAVQMLIKNAGPIHPDYDKAIRNNYYLKLVTESIQQPSAENGGISISDGRVVPSYWISPGVDEIVKRLSAKDKARAFRFTNDPDSETGDEFSFSLNGEREIRIKGSDLISMCVESDLGADTKECIDHCNLKEVSITVHGETLVYFEPMAWNFKKRRDWFWVKPIIEAVENQKSGGFGFRFSVPPQFDFSKNGAFSFLDCILISPEPLVELYFRSPRMSSIEKGIGEGGRLNLKLLSQEMGEIGSDGTYRVEMIDGGDSLLLSPNEENNNLVESNLRAFVLGVSQKWPICVGSKR